MSKQIANRIDEDIYRSLQTEAEIRDTTVREILEESLEIGLGLDAVDAVDNIRRQIEQLENDVNRLEDEKEKIENELTKKREKLERRRQNLEQKLSERKSVEAIQTEILDEINETDKSIDAFMSELRDIQTQSTEIDSIGDAKDAVYDRYSGGQWPEINPVAQLDRSQAIARTGSTTQAMTDGAADNKLGLEDLRSTPDDNDETTNDDNDDNDDDPEIMTDGGVDVSDNTLNQNARRYVIEQFSDYIDDDPVFADIESNQRPPEKIDRELTDEPYHIDYLDVVGYDPDIALDYLNNEEGFREAIRTAIAQYESDKQLDHIDPVLVNLPDKCHRYVDEISVTDVGEYRTVIGQIQETTGQMIDVHRAHYVCEGCGTPFEMLQPLLGREEPHECPGCERGSTGWDTDYGNSELRDIEVVTVAETPERVSGGSEETVMGVLVGDQTGSINPGDRVEITGQLTVHDDHDHHGQHDYVLKSRDVRLTDSSYGDIEFTDEVVDEIEELAADQPIETLVDSFAPDHRGDRDIKLGILLQLFGGVHGETSDGGRTRGDIHQIIVGDPSTGKSQLLEAAASISPRAARISGKSTTEAGLLAAALPAENRDGMRLSAGAMVKASGGIAAIDELDKIPDEVVSSLHDSMGSKQIVNVNKGGFNTSLPSRTAVLAAANPTQGRFDPYEPIPQQINMESTLLSRMDLIWTLTDDIDDIEAEKEKAGHILESTVEATERAAGRADDDDLTNQIVDQDTLRHWVAYGRRIKPQIPDDVIERLRDYYATLRTSVDDDDGQIPITARSLQAAVRLCQASARARLSDTVSVDDAERAVGLLESSMKSVGVDPETDTFDADIIETGQSKSQRDRIKNLKGLINELDDGSGAEIDELLEQSDEIGMDVGKVEDEIEKLRQNGEIFKPKAGHWRVN